MDFIIEPLLDRVLVLPLPKEEKKSNIIILDDTKKEAEKLEIMSGLVIAVGPGKDGKSVALVPGDIILCYPTTFETPVEINGVQHLIYPERNIIAKKIAMKMPDVSKPFIGEA